jgi:Flp pilus assembly protein TadD
MMLLLAGFATFASLKYEWIIEQVEIWMKPSPEKSEKLLKQGKMNEARQSIQKQLREKPNDIELLTLQGRFYIGAARQRMNDKQWKNYGEAGAMPELDSATAFFHKAESLDPKDSNIPRWISVAEQLRRNLPEAETYARRAVTIAPQVEDNWNQLGSVLVDEEQVSQAEKAFYNALKINQTNAAALKNLTILNLYYTKDAEKAAKFLFSFLSQKEAETDMDTYQLRTDLTTAMIGDFNQPWGKLTPPPLPFDEYEKRRAQIAANPNLNNEPLLQEQLGMLYMSRGEAKVAELNFIGAINLNQKVESSRKMLAIIYMKDANYESALKMMEAAVENGAKDPFFWKNIGVLKKYFKANPAEANKAFSRYISLGGDTFENRIRKEMQK